MPDGKRFVPRPTTEKQQVANLTKLVALREGTESHMARLATLNGKSVTIATGSTLPLQSLSARVPDDIRRATVHPPKWSIQTHFNHGKIASCSGFGKSIMGDTLQDRRVNTGSRWSKRGLGHVANTTLPPPRSQ
jgi:hypothetical protein